MSPTIMLVLLLLRLIIMLKTKQIKMALFIKQRNGILAAAKYLKRKGFSVEAAMYLLTK